MSLASYPLPCSKKLESADKFLAYTANGTKRWGHGLQFQGEWGFLHGNGIVIFLKKKETKAIGRCKICPSFCLMRQGRFLINNKNSRTSKAALVRLSGTY
jgi:hypothetical protein